MKALWTFDGDRTEPCEGCDGDCDEPCAPHTVSEAHADIDRQIAELVKAGKLFDNTPLNAIHYMSTLSKNDGTCKYCDDGDGICLFPHYGVAPHAHDESRFVRRA